MRLKTLIILLLFLCMTSIANAAAYYTIEMTAPAANKDLVYVDDDIAMKFSIPAKNIAQFPFVLKNRTSQPIKVDWNQISSISTNGSTLRIYHAGILYADAYGAKPLTPTIIPPAAHLKDYLGVANYHSYTSYGGWSENYVFPILYPHATPLLNSQFSLFIPLEINGEIKNYTFTFHITNIEKKWPPKSYLGIHAVDQKSAILHGVSTPIEKGILILEVTPKSAAMKAGMRKNDFIVQMNGKNINSIDDLDDALATCNPKESATITVMRNNQPLVVPVILDKAPRPL